MPRLPVRVRMNKVRFRATPERVTPKMPRIRIDSGQEWTGTLQDHPGRSGQVPNLQIKARRIAEHMSRPDTPMNVQRLAKATWVKQPGEKITTQKPFTLRDLADPAGAFPDHGQLIFIFRNVQTNQILYSLSEVLDESHLGQIPFFAKHSSPPSLRRDVWTPHAVVSFPTSEQGHNAFRKLREFRKMHELCWDKTNPEWIRDSAQTRMRRIMDQKANTTADLAKVLSMQADQGVWMQQNLEAREKEEREFLFGKKDLQIDAEKDKKRIKKRKEELIKGKWTAIKEMADLAETGEIKRLEIATKNLTWRLERIRPGKNDKLKGRLEKAILANKNRTDRLHWARRRAYAFNLAREELEKTAANKNTRVAKLERKMKVEREKLAKLTNPERMKAQETVVSDLHRDLQAAQEEAEEKARIAKEKLDTEDHHAAKLILPRHLTIPLPAPYVAEGIEVQWADLLDAEYAKGAWPEEIAHTVLPLTKQRTETTVMRPDEFEAAIDKDRQAIFDDWVAQYEEKNNTESAPAKLEQKTEKKTGLSRYLPLPSIKNPFKRADTGN